MAELRIEAAKRARMSPLYMDLTVSFSKSISVFHASLGENARLARQAWNFTQNAVYFSPSGGVEMWRGGVRSVATVAAPFVWRCRNRGTVIPFPVAAHRTGRAELPHPAFRLASS